MSVWPSRTSIPPKIELARQSRGAIRTTRVAVQRPSGDPHAARPSLLSNITDAMILAAAPSDQDRRPDARARPDLVHVRAAARAQGRPLGAMTFGSAESGRRLRAADLQFAEDLAGRASLAVDNARAYDEARRANRSRTSFSPRCRTNCGRRSTRSSATRGCCEAGVVAPDKRHDGARRSSSATRRALTQIVEDVLDVSRIVSGKLRLKSQPVDLPRSCADGASSRCGRRPTPRACARRRCSIRAPPVSGDPDRLQQVIWNLLSNAVKFTPPRRPGPGSPGARATRTSKSSSATPASGIAPAFLPHVFERFRQADSRFYARARRARPGPRDRAASRRDARRHDRRRERGRRTGRNLSAVLPLMVVHPIRDDAIARASPSRRGRPS